MKATNWKNEGQFSPTTGRKSPFYILKLVWRSGSTTVDLWFSETDRAMEGSGNKFAKGRIMEIGQIEHRLIDEYSTSVSSCKITLADTDLDMWTRLQSENPVNIEAELYVHFEESLRTNPQLPDEMMLLYEGILDTPITYDHSHRIMTFDVVPPLDGLLVPYAPSEADQTAGTSTQGMSDHTDEKYLGSPIPMPFGRTVDVPATLLANYNYTKLATAIDHQTSATFKITTEPFGDDNPYLVPRASRNYFIGEELVTGSFGGGSQAKDFTFSARNVSRNSFTTLRPAPSADPDSSRSDVLYCPAKIVGTWVVLSGKGTTGAKENFCIRQIGNKCFFLSGWRKNNNNNWTPNSGKTLTYHRYHSAGTTTWQHQQGSVMREEVSYKTYCVSGVPLDNTAGLLRVRAWRQVPVFGGRDAGETARVLITVPDSYYRYERNFSAFSFPVDGGTVNPSLVIFDIPLEHRFQGWETDVIYCTMKTEFTTASSGEKSTPEQIAYILKKYTRLQPDDSSFASVRVALSNFPSDLALSPGKTALQYAIEMAFQCRCALTIVGRTVKIKYLSVDQPTRDNADSTVSAILFKFRMEANKLSILQEPPAQLYQIEQANRATKIVGKFRESLAFPVPLTFIDTVDDVAQYDERVREIDWWLYPDRTLVKKSVKWWVERLGTAFQLLTVQMGITAFLYEPNDFIYIDLLQDELEDNQTTRILPLCCGIVKEVALDPHQFSGTVTFWVPVEAGTNIITGWKSVNAPSPAISNPHQGIPTTESDTIEAVATSEDGT